MENLECEKCKYFPKNLVDDYLKPALFSNKILLNQVNDMLDVVQMDSGKFKLVI
jgi:hypothetical protein